MALQIEPISLFSFVFCLVSLLYIFSTLPSVHAVKAEDFKTCQQSGFCRRQRSYAQFQQSYPSSPPLVQHLLDASTVLLEPESGHYQAEIKRIIQGVPKDAGTQQSYVFHIYTLHNQMIRFRLVDPKESRPLFPLHKHLFDDPEKQLRTAPYTLAQSPIPATIDLRFGHSLLRVHYKPFKVECLVHGQVVFTFNEKNTLLLETGQNGIPKHILSNLEKSASTAPSDDPPSSSFVMDETKSHHRVNDSSPLSYLSTLHTIFEDGAYEESFKHFTDSKPYGPRSFGVDINFPTSKHVFGLAEHATDLDLPSTTGPNATYTAPYRLYNLDVFEYDLHSPMALYGAVPYLHAMSGQGSFGLLVLSGSEMWVDIDRAEADGIRTHWMVESNPMDLYFWAAETPLALHATFLAFSGTPYLPPLFALGYHQSRWNYVSVDHVKEVDDQFDAHEIPYDVIWLDIEHTHEKRYFTWDPVKFKDHVSMMDRLKQKHRKLVTIIDPHIKVDSNYFVSAEASKKDVFVKSKDRQVFHGHCWSGDSNWIDFTQSNAVDLWKTFFSQEKNPQGIETFTWNDMNEPSVFSGPEITLPKDTLHGPYEHRDVHNVYGMLFHKATMLGQLSRAQVRPFVLSRAFFLGTQKYGAVWTGDNMSKWSHLEASMPMVLALSVCGIHFGGADVGGFFGNPDNALMVRWYQAAAFQPFFRGHAHIDAKHREPYLFKDHKYIRDVILLRYRLMPMLYTVFAQRTVPPMMPLFFKFHQDPLAFRHDLFLVGLTGLLVAPVTVEGATEKHVYLPGIAPWYSVVDLDVYRPGPHVVAAPLSTLPLFVQGGHILVTRDRPRRNVMVGVLDPLSLYVYLNDEGESEGEFRFDDFVTLDEGHLMVKMVYQKGQLTANLTSVAYTPPSEVRVERIVVVHAKPFLTAPLVGEVDKSKRVYTIKEPQLLLSMAQWRLRIFPA